MGFGPQDPQHWPLGTPSKVPPHGKDPGASCPLFPGQGLSLCASSPREGLTLLQGVGGLKGMDIH